MNLFNDHCLSGSLSLSLSLSNSLYASVPSKFAYSMHSTILSECHLDFKAINTISFSKFDLNKRETQKLGMAFKCGLKHECRKTRKPKKFTHQIFKWLKVLLTPSLKLRITAFRAGNQTKLSIDFFIKWISTPRTIAPVCVYLYLCLLWHLLKKKKNKTNLKHHFGNGNSCNNLLFVHCVPIHWIGSHQNKSDINRTTKFKLYLDN